MADSVNDQLLDQSIKHAVYIERYSKSVVRRMLAVLKKSNVSLRAELLERLYQIEARGFDTGPWTTARLEAMIKSINAHRAINLQSIGQSISDELKSFAAYESPFLVAKIKTSVPKDVLVHMSIVTPTPDQVYAAALSRPFQGKLLSDALSSFVAADAARIREAIRIGFVTGQSTTQIVKNIFGSGVVNGTILGTSRNLTAVVRTALQHISATAQKEVLAQNTDLIKGVKYIATLDGRTTPICRALDNKTWAADSKKIRWPPQHWQCRSRTTYITKSWRELDINASELSTGTRASMNGQVPADTTYGVWLRKMDKTDSKFVDDVLGKTRAALFRRGGLSMERFVDYNTGRQFTLDELKTRESKTWQSVFS